MACLGILSTLTLHVGMAVESVLNSFVSEYISQAPFTMIGKESLAAEGIRLLMDCSHSFVNPR